MAWVQQRLTRGRPALNLRSPDERTVREEPRVTTYWMTSQQDGGVVLFGVISEARIGPGSSMGRCKEIRWQVHSAWLIHGMSSGTGPQALVRRRSATRSCMRQRCRS